VQRPNVGERVTGSHDIPAFREAQAAALELTNTAMVVATDIGRLDDIHPTNMQDYGYRLGLLAEALAYGRDVVWSGPVFQALRWEDHALRLHFAHAEGGLVAGEDGAVTGFELAGEDGKLISCEARIDGQDVLVSASGVAKPVSIRFAWAANPVFNLYNRAGLPAGPFVARVPDSEEP
jgi:sialate O-acetylesterase